MRKALALCFQPGSARLLYDFANEQDEWHFHVVFVGKRIGSDSPKVTLVPSRWLYFTQVLFISMGLVKGWEIAFRLLGYIFEMSNAWRLMGGYDLLITRDLCTTWSGRVCLWRGKKLLYSSGTPPKGIENSIVADMSLEKIGKLEEYRVLKSCKGWEGFSPKALVTTDRWYCQYADHVICMSEFAKREYSKLTESKVDIVYPRLRKQEKISSEIYANKDISAIKICTVGRFCIRKGFFLVDRLVRDSAGICKVSYTHIGEYPERYRSHYSKRQLSCEFNGTISSDRMQYVLREFDILVLPSFSEGAGLVVPEALAAGLKVVASKNTIAWDMRAEDNVFIIGEVTLKGIWDAILAAREVCLFERQSSDNKRRECKSREWNAMSHAQLRAVLSDVMKR